MQKMHLPTPNHQEPGLNYNQLGVCFAVDVLKESANVNTELLLFVTNVMKSTNAMISIIAVNLLLLIK